MTQPYDSTWDTSDDADVFDKKCEEWAARDWAGWLSSHLSFPFEVRREEDMEGISFEPDDASFAVGCRMRVTSLGEEDSQVGFYICVESGKNKGVVPLADVKVLSKTDVNFWPVREYVVWMANH